MPRPVTIVGAGRMGLALGSAFADTEAVGDLTICGRRPEPPDHPLFGRGRAEYVFGLEPLDPRTMAVFLAVPDAAVPDMAFALGTLGPAPEGCVAFHLSGVLPTDVMAPLHGAGFELGVFHPLQAIADPIRDAGRLPGSYVDVTGAPLAMAIARDLADAIGCRTLVVPANRRPLHHAATVLAGHYLTPLLATASRLMEHAGVSREDALPALLPLVRSTLERIEERGITAPVSGPLTRSDVETVALHLRALDPEDQRLYALFGVEMMRFVGPELDDRERAALTELFDRYAGLETSGTRS